jgi:hypothetical protein
VSRKQLFLLAESPDTHESMSEFRVEKRRVAAVLTLATSATLKGSFFVAGSAATHDGAERVGDLLNAQAGFFPFELDSGVTALFNRAHVVTVGLPPGVAEAALDPGYEVARRRTVAILLSTGARLAGSVAVYRPAGRDRLSDYAKSDEQFRYVVTADRTILVNSAHIVELTETGAS